MKYSMSLEEFFDDFVDVLILVGFLEIYYFCSLKVGVDVVWFFYVICYVIVDLCKLMIIFIDVFRNFGVYLELLEMMNIIWFSFWCLMFENKVFL